MTAGRVLVTGATGFIGEVLVARLRSEGHDVQGIGSANGDIREPGTLRDFNATGITHVFHLAARSYVPDSWSDPHGFMDVNIRGTLNVLDFCRTTGAALTFASGFIYGVPESVPVSESAPVRPNNPYAQSKACAEELCHFYASHLGVSVGIARLFNVYGPGQDERFLIPELLGQARSRPEIRVRDLTPRRDFIHVDDAVDAICRLAAKRPRFGIFNVASGTSVSVAGIIALVQEALGTDKPVISEDTIRPNEIPDSTGDATLAASELGWRPQVSLRHGIRMLANDR